MVELFIHLRSRNSGHQLPSGFIWLQISRITHYSNNDNMITSQDGIKLFLANKIAD